MSKLVEELRKYVELKRSSTMRVTRTEAVELLAHIERLEAAVQAVKDWDIENFKERGAFVVPQEIRQTIQIATRGEGE